MIAQSMLIQPPKNEAEIKEIKELSAIFGDKNIKIITPSGYQIEIPYSILSLFKTVIETLNNGDALTIIPMHKELTTQQAADVLNVSRPYFIKLLENGEISFNKVGRHRRISMLDLLEYKIKRDKIRKENLDELSKLGQDLGLYD